MVVVVTPPAYRDRPFGTVVAVVAGPSTIPEPKPPDLAALGVAAMVQPAALLAPDPMVWAVAAAVAAMMVLVVMVAPVWWWLLMLGPVLARAGQ
jgi:hypothetical protein